MTIERKFISDSIIKLNISRFLSKELMKAGFSRVSIQKTPIITRINLYVLYSGKVIGRGGKTIDALKENIKRNFNIYNPQITVNEVQNRMLEPMLVARHMSEMLERGFNPRKLIQMTLRSIIENGAMGAEIRLSGKLQAKKAKTRTIIKRVGYIPKAGDVTNLVSEAITAAYPKYGAIGIQVRIVPPGTVFPGQKTKNVELPKSIATAR
ncbi:MAG: 30S ribosomal protein S3 [Candidatus Micrarchaeia archaeon]